MREKNISGMTCKKYIKICILGYMCFFASSLAFADNAVQMVTYFPVPYAAYNNVFVSQKFDVGTNTGNFTLDLGDASNCNEGISLRAENVNLAHITNNSALGFNTDIYTKSALFGNKNATGHVTMKFNKLRINTLNAAKDQAVAEIDAKDVTVQGDMYMFEDYVQDAALPECTDAKWKNLQIGSKTGYYLVCGEGTESTGTSPCDISTHTTVYNACINSGGSWNANAVSSASCCICPANTSIQADGSCNVPDLIWFITEWVKLPYHPEYGRVGCPQINRQANCPNEDWDAINNVLSGVSELAPCANEGVTCKALVIDRNGVCENDYNVTLTCQKAPQIIPR